MSETAITIMTFLIAFVAGSAGMWMRLHDDYERGVMDGVKWAIDAFINIIKQHKEDIE